MDVKITDELKRGFDALFRYLEKGNGDMYKVVMLCDGNYIDDYEYDKFESISGNGKDIPINPYFEQYFEKLFKIYYDNYIGYYAGNDYDSYYQLGLFFNVKSKTINVRTNEFVRNESDSDDFFVISDLREEKQNDLKEFMESIGEETLSTTFEGGGDNGFIRDYSTDDIMINDKVMDILYSVLSKKYPGFENDDGGEGTMTIDLPENEIKIEMVYFDREMVETDLNLNITE